MTSVMPITSATNSRVKYLRKLRQKKFREALNFFVVENPLIIKDGLAHGATIDELFITPSFQEKNTAIYHSMVSKLVPEKINSVSDDLLASSVSLEQPQGVAAIYRKPSEQTDLGNSIVYLNGVSDPGNVGAIMRSAAAFGIISIVLDEHTADAYNPKTISAAKESIFTLKISRRGASYLSEVKRLMPVYGLDSRGDLLMSELKWGNPFCLVLGSEAHGLSEEIKSMANKLIRINFIQGSVESLNVAAAAAIALHQSFQAK